MTRPHTTPPAQGQPTWTALRGSMALAAASFAAASIVHFGVTIALGPVEVYDPFPGAAIPEAVIAVALVGGLAATTSRQSAGSWGLLATSLFALLLTTYGMTVTVGSGRTGDVVYHVAVLGLLLVIVALLLLPRKPSRPSTGDDRSTTRAGERSSRFP